MNTTKNIKHILRQSLYAMYLLEAAIEKRNTIFEGRQDPLSIFFAKEGSKLTTHMAVISMLYNFIVVPKECILKADKKYTHHYEHINSELHKISKILHKDNEDGDKDLLRRLRNSLAHGDFILKDGGFIFHDEYTNGKNKIDFYIESLSLPPLIDYIQWEIMLPFINQA